MKAKKHRSVEEREPQPEFPLPVQVSRYRKKDEGDDSELYTLKIVPDDPRGHTHVASNAHKYWSGDRFQFLSQFSEVEPQ